MSLWVVIPARPPEDGKSRLAPVLSTDERRSLNERLFRHSLAVATQVVGAIRCLVVSKSPLLRSIAEGAGAAHLFETGDGLNPALEQAAAEVRSRGATAVLSLACDLPLLGPADLAAIIAETAALVIAPDHSGVGTNALLARIPVRYRYGPDSRALHEAGVPSVAIAHREGLARDLDTPADFEALAPTLDRAHLRF